VAPAASPSERILRPRKREPASQSRQRQHRRHVTATTLLLLGLVGVVLLHVWLRLQVVHMGYVLSTTSKLQNQLEQEHRELKVELATLTSPDRLEAMSRRRLGLTLPEKGQVIVLP
jgi:cell division protein FtsL